jgi:hypothetical protein
MQLGRSAHVRKRAPRQLNSANGIATPEPKRAVVAGGQREGQSRTTNDSAGSSAEPSYYEGDGLSQPWLSSWAPSAFAARNSTVVPRPCLSKYTPDEATSTVETLTSSTMDLLDLLKSSPVRPTLADPNDAAPIQHTVRHAQGPALDSSSLIRLPDSPGKPSAGDYRECIVSVYRVANPSKLGELPSLFSKYRGRERELWDVVQRKYAHVESPPPVAVTTTPMKLPTHHTKESTDGGRSGGESAVALEHSLVGPGGLGAAALTPAAVTAAQVAAMVSTPGQMIIAAAAGIDPAQKQPRSPAAVQAVQTAATAVHHREHAVEHGRTGLTVGPDGVERRLEWTAARTLQQAARRWLEGTHGARKQEWIQQLELLRWRITLL